VQDDQARALRDTWAAIVAVDEDCSIRLFNGEAERITGRAASDVEGQHFCDAMGLDDCSPDRATCAWRPAIDGAERRTQPRELTARVDGRRLDLLIGARHSPTPDGRPGALITFVDHSSYRTLEQTRATLMADVFHELRSPLSAITMAAYFLSADFADLQPERARTLLNTIHHNASTLLSDLNDLLNRSTFTNDAPSVLPRALNLADVIEQATWKLQPLLDERGQRVRTIDTPLPLVWADERRVEQVLVNLLANANKYSVADDEIVLVVEVEGPSVRVTVEDHGPGLPPDEQKRVFDRFYRGAKTAASVTGAGLGLSIVRKIVEAHGGRIGVEDSKPHGARFWFTLPLAEASSQKPSDQGQKRAASG